MEYYSAVKNNDIIKFEGKWMELEKILSGIIQTQKDKHGMYSLIYISCKIKEDHATTYRPREARLQGGPKGETNLSAKGK